MKKYLHMENFNPPLPKTHENRSSKLDSFKKEIDEGWKRTSRNAKSSATQPNGFLSAYRKNTGQALTTPTAW